MNIVDDGTIASIDSYPSEELTALAFTILNRSLEEPQLAKQLEPYEWYVLVVDNTKRETGRAGQVFNPPDNSPVDKQTWDLARSMMLQMRDVAAVAKLSPEVHEIALHMTLDLLQVLAPGITVRMPG